MLDEKAMREAFEKVVNLMPAGTRYCLERHKISPNYYALTETDSAFEGFKLTMGFLPQISRKEALELMTERYEHARALAICVCQILEFKR